MTVDYQHSYSFEGQTLYNRLEPRENDGQVWKKLKQKVLMKNVSYWKIRRSIG